MLSWANRRFMSPHFQLSATGTLELCCGVVAEALPTAWTYRRFCYPYFMSHFGHLPVCLAGQTCRPPGPTDAGRRGRQPCPSVADVSRQHVTDRNACCRHSTLCQPARHLGEVAGWVAFPRGSIPVGVLDANLPTNFPTEGATLPRFLGFCSGFCAFSQASKSRASTMFPIRVAGMALCLAPTTSLVRSSDFRNKPVFRRPPVRKQPIHGYATSFGCDLGWAGHRAELRRETCTGLKYLSLLFIFA